MRLPRGDKGAEIRLKNSGQQKKNWRRLPGRSTSSPVEGLRTSSTVGMKRGRLLHTERGNCHGSSFVLLRKTCFSAIEHPLPPLLPYTHRPTHPQKPSTRRFIPVVPKIKNGCIFDKARTQQPLHFYHRLESSLLLCLHKHLKPLNNLQPDVLSISDTLSNLDWCLFR